MTLETLADIILDAAIYNENIVLTLADVSKLYQHLKNQNNDAAKDLLQKKREVKIDIWDKIFKQYFIEPESFQQQLTQFIKCRNHIAHNKLLTLTVFNQMLDELNTFESTVLKATDLFESANASVELLDTMACEDEHEAYWDEHMRDIIISETGVKIRSADEIYELFCETVMELYEDLADRYHYDPCFEVSNAEQPIWNGYSSVCTVICNASGDELEIITSMSLDGEMNSTSCLNIEAKHNNKTVTEVECTYYNGEAHEDDSGVFMPDSDSEYNDSRIPDFLEDLMVYINDELNPYLERLFSLEYEYGKYGGEKPVADFVCAECGKTGVSILEDFLPIGKCCYCGYENDVNICEICGTVYDDMGGNEHLCNGCVPKDD